MPSTITKEKAIKAYDGMAEIVRHEMLIQGSYVDNEISNPRLAKSGAICGGHKHCAIGSLWVGAGIKYRRTNFGSIYLPGVKSWNRNAFLRPRHGLRLAYDKLNEAAKEFADRRKLEFDCIREGFLEDLFEGHYGDDLTKGDLLRIIAAAKRKVKAA